MTVGEFIHRYSSYCLPLDWMEWWQSLFQFPKQTRNLQTTRNSETKAFQIQSFLSSLLHLQCCCNWTPLHWFCFFPSSRRRSRFLQFVQEEVVSEMLQRLETKLCSLQGKGRRLEAKGKKESCLVNVSFLARFTLLQRSSTSWCGFLTGLKFELDSRAVPVCGSTICFKHKIHVSFRCSFSKHGKRLIIRMNWIFIALSSASERLPNSKLQRNDGKQSYEINSLANGFTVWQSAILSFQWITVQNQKSEWHSSATHSKTASAQRNLQKTSWMESPKASCPRKEGYLTKKGDKRRNWKKRFFILSDGTLKYYANPPSSPKEEETKILGSIQISGCLCSPTTSVGKQYKNSFQVNSLRTHFQQRRL